MFIGPAGSCLRGVSIPIDSRDTGIDSLEGMSDAFQRIRCHSIGELRRVCPKDGTHVVWPY